MLVEIEERSEILERDRPFELFLIEAPEFSSAGHPELQAIFVEEGLVPLGEELFDNKLEGVAIHVLPLIFLGFLYPLLLSNLMVGRFDRIRASPLRFCELYALLRGTLNVSRTLLRALVSLGFHWLKLSTIATR